MENTTDILRFRQLMLAWLEAETSLSEEQELFALATRLKTSECDTQTRRDLNLIIGVSDLKATQKHQTDFESFVAKITQKPHGMRHTAVKWLRITGIAATVALIATAGVWMFHAKHIPPANTPDALAQTMVAQADLNNQPEKISSAEQPQPDIQTPRSTNKIAVTAYHYGGTKKGSVKTMAPESATLEAREITDPQEAAAILSQSCALLAKCVDTAEQESCRAINTVSENIQSSLDIII